MRGGCYFLYTAVVSAIWAVPTAAHEGSVGFFVRGDSDQTLVLSPRAAIAAELNDNRSRARAAYTADIWTSASIDIRTAATRAVTEQRDQLEMSFDHEMGDVMAAGDVYFSTETDYTAYGAGVSSTQNVANNSASLEERLSFGYDVVGRAGDALFQRPARNVGARVVYTQALDAKHILQGAWELGHRWGYQSSPYRFVGMGGDGACNGTAQLCVPEDHPRRRSRSAWAVRSRHALARESSLGFDYRLYLDSWGVLSHTAAAQLAWLTDDSVITARYRIYVQSAASFYQRVYALPAENYGDVTRDRELSPIFSNRLSLSYQKRFELDDAGRALRLGLVLGGTVFVYGDFVGLDEVYAGDASLAITVEH